MVVGALVVVLRTGRAAVVVVVVGAAVVEVVVVVGAVVVVGLVAGTIATVVVVVSATEEASTTCTRVEGESSVQATNPAPAAALIRAVQTSNKRGVEWPESDRPGSTERRRTGWIVELCDAWMTWICHRVTIFSDHLDQIRLFGT